MVFLVKRWWLSDAPPGCEAKHYDVRRDTAEAAGMVIFTKISLMFLTDIFIIKKEMCCPSDPDFRVSCCFEIRIQFLMQTFFRIDFMRHNFLLI